MRILNTIKSKFNLTRIKNYQNHKLFQFELIKIYLHGINKRLLGIKTRLNNNNLN